jgi:RimJ/RimL family protein N-acetyltransferase
VPYLIPEEIATERLVLRTFDHDDWRAMHELYSDEACTAFTMGRALTEGESWRTVASIAGHWLLRGYGPYAVEEKSSRAVIGTVGLWYPNDWPGPEIKWALARRYWGRGFASEAARAVKEMAAEYLPRTSLISFIHSENAASIRVALAVGARFEKEVDFRNGRWRIYRHHRASQNET